MNLYVECKSPTLCGVDVSGKSFLVERVVKTINGEFYELSGMFSGGYLFHADKFVESIKGYTDERDRLHGELLEITNDTTRRLAHLKNLDDKIADLTRAVDNETGFNEGDIVVCVNAGPWGYTPDTGWGNQSGKLTDGRQYTVHEAYRDQIVVLNDAGYRSNFPAIRFAPKPVVRHAVLVDDHGMKHLNVKVGNIYEIQRDIMVGAEQRFYIVDDNLSEIGGWRADRFVEIEERAVKVGDEVICVDPGRNTYLELCKKYTVSALRGNGFFDFTDCYATFSGYPPKRFRAVKAAEQQHEEWADPEVPPKPKQIVLKDRLDDPSAYLTTGQVYEVKHVAIEGGESYYHIIDDMGKQSGGWYWQRFVEITDEPFAVGDLVVKLAGVVGSDFRDGRLMSVESIGQRQSKLYMDGGAYTFVSNNMLRKVVT